MSRVKFIFLSLKSSALIKHFRKHIKGYISVNTQIIGGLLTVIANVTVIRGLQRMLSKSTCESQNEGRVAQHGLSGRGADVIYELVCGNAVKRLISLDRH